MSKEAQKKWLRRMALEYLQEIRAPLSNLERLSDGAKAMPAPLRQKIRSAIKSVEETAAAVHAWPITERERSQSLREYGKAADDHNPQDNRQQ